ncbi:MAG TPA: reverse transcriptase/maturase family protein [Patescibacteria group bacterium]|nr:reverse transcriptase/maturase family protein [Patescibacteria group bacterium]
MKIQLTHTYSDIISVENLLNAWQEFIIGKKTKPDVKLFARDLMDNILALHEDLVKKSYTHGRYHSFYINDPKRRHIHKASVRDRLLHHAIYRILYPFFDRTFIADSFSCRDSKGTRKAIERFQSMAYQVSRNHTRTCWVLKCDIQKFFASVDQKKLFDIVRQYIPDQDILTLLHKVVDSFHTTGMPGTGLPLGNLTSQLLTNVYMNVLDQWVKHRLAVETHCVRLTNAKDAFNASLPYVRYADDFLFLSANKEWLKSIIPALRDFLSRELCLTLHPNKIILKTIASGVDFLGWTHFADHRTLRNKTKQRLFRKIKASPTEATLQSYLGLLNHGNAEKIRRQVLGEYWLWQL